MTPPRLHIFAIDQSVTTRHTNLTRAKGAAPDLPPLAEWIGADSLATDRVELFPIEDLGDLDLSAYVGMAFDLEVGPLATAARRLNAIDGTVLLAPDTSVTGALMPGPEAMLIASLPMVMADHDADLPKAAIMPRPSPPVPEPDPAPPQPVIAIWILLAVLVAAAILWWLA